MKITIIILSILTSFVSNVYAKDKGKDHLICSKYIESVEDKNISLVKGMHKKMQESISYFHHQINLNILKEFKGAKNPEVITYETYKVTELALQTLTPKYVYGMCKNKPKGTLEGVSRATWLAIQEINNEKITR